MAPASHSKSGQSISACTGQGAALRAARYGAGGSLRVLQALRVAIGARVPAVPWAPAPGLGVYGIRTLGVFRLVVTHGGALGAAPVGTVRVAAWADVVFAPEGVGDLMGGAEVQGLHLWQLKCGSGRVGRQRGHSCQGKSKQCN